MESAPNEKIRVFLVEGYEALAEHLNSEELTWLKEEYGEVLEELSALEEKANSPLLMVKLPDPPKDPRTEDDEYEPPLGLSQDV